MSKRTWCRINAEASGGAEILIYDVIGSWFMDTDAASIANQIKAIDADEITVRINSPGGSAFDGVAIMNALRAHEARIVVRVDGLAASAASVIAMAGDEIVMGPGSQMMIHEAWVFTEGDAGFLRSEADRLDKMSDSITSLYAKRAGGDFDEWRALVAAETWFTADEAVTAGLADRVDGEAVDSGELAATFNLSHFRFAGRGQAPAPRIPSAEAVEVNNRKEGEMPDLMKGLRERLGFAENADEATILAALDEALTERAEGTQEQPLSELIAKVQSHGLAVVDEDRLKAAEAGAAAGAEALARHERAEREQLVQSAVASGKIPPARAQHWVDAIAADAGLADVLKAMPDNLIPVAEIGHDGDGVQSKAEDLGWF